MSRMKRMRFAPDSHISSQVRVQVEICYNSWATTYTIYTNLTFTYYCNMSEREKIG